MKKYLLLMLTGLIMTAMSCNKKANPKPPPPPRPSQQTNVKGQKLRFESLAKGFYCGMDKPTEMVVRDPSEFARLWARVYKGQTPKPRPPKIDFEREMVLVVGMGTRNSGGYNIEITNVFSTPDNVIVSVRKHLLVKEW